MFDCYSTEYSTKTGFNVTFNFISSRRQWGQSNTCTLLYDALLLNLVHSVSWHRLAGISEDVYKHDVKCGLVRPQRTFPLCVSPSQMSSFVAAFVDDVDIWLWLCVLNS